jgi:hypothetical protein
MIATNRRPGLFRTNYAFMHLQGYDESVYLQEDALLEKQIIDVPVFVSSLQIIAQRQLKMQGRMQLQQV